MCKTPGANSIKAMFLKDFTANFQILSYITSSNLIGKKIVERIQFVEGQKAGFEPPLAGIDFSI